MRLHLNVQQLSKPAEECLGRVGLNPKHILNCHKEHVHCFRGHVLELTPAACHENLIQVFRVATGKATQNVAVDMHVVLDLGDCIKVAISAGQGGTNDLIPKADIE